MSEVAIVGFDADLLEEAALLRAAVWGGTPEINGAYLSWKYLRNPYIAEPLVHFAVHAGAVIGMRGSMGTCWELHGRRHVLPHGGDVVVDPRFRRRGIALEMQRAYLEELSRKGLKATISLSTGGMGTPTSVAGGWQVVARLDVLECPGTRLPPRARRVGRRAAARLAALTGVGRGSPPVNPLASLDDEVGGAIRVVETVAVEELAAIAARVAPSTRLRHVRDAEYFGWRLADPLHRYRALVSQDAYLVLEWSGKGVNVADWRADDARALSQLFGVAVAQLGKVRMWAASVDAELMNTLARFGRLSYDPGPSASFVFRTTAGDPRDAYLGGLDLNEPTSWDLRMLDSDEY